ncbi:hypothetical protein THRCLA_21113 [Thraustotheca clavata]|uniref:Uncharacterized protein n=1 Tax=Thraustotheca clavata TaxID=74557 RepID=A0A1W0A057_9STRA|nr:hypothetical protein THRCLA_21113 [Thraustotheca clavata]
MHRLEQSMPLYGTREQFPVLRKNTLAVSKLSNVSSMSLSAQHSVDYLTESLPAKLSVDFVTPYKNQVYRSTCWDFTTIGVLEHSYRLNGIKHG